MRLSDNDSSYIAARSADTALELIDDAFDSPLEAAEYERVGDDITEGFRRVLRATEILP